MVSHSTPHSLTFPFAMATTAGLLSLFMMACANMPRLRSKIRWGYHGRGYPMSSFGAWSWSAYLMSLGAFFAVSASHARWVHIGASVFFGACFVEMIYAALRDRNLHANEGRTPERQPLERIAHGG